MTCASPQVTCYAPMAHHAPAVVGYAIMFALVVLPMVLAACALSRNRPASNPSDGCAPSDLLPASGRQSA